MLNCMHAHCKYSSNCLNDLSLITDILLIVCVCVFDSLRNLADMDVFSKSDPSKYLKIATMEPKFSLHAYKL